MKVIALTGLSITVIVLLTIIDFKPLTIGLDCISYLPNSYEFEKFALRLCAGNFLFKLTGILISILGLIDVIRFKDKPTFQIKLLWVYTLIAIILALPIYHRHPGFGGTEKHGHSFWNGGLHFH